MSTLGPPGQRLSFGQLESLWVSNGGDPAAAPIMAAIAIAESGGLTNNLNDNPKTGDYSVGLWQINYYDKLGPGRTASYGAPAQLAADPAAQVKAAMSLSKNGTNLKPWTTWTSGAATQVLRSQGAAPPLLPMLSGPTATSSPVFGIADEEGWLVDLTMPSAIPNIRISRSVVRRIAGGVVLAAGAVVGLAGVFVLVGGKAPGPAGVVKTAIRQRRQTRQVQTRETGLSERQARRSTVSAERDDLAKRRRARQSKAEEGTRSARAEGERAAEAAGDF